MSEENKITENLSLNRDLICEAFNRTEKEFEEALSDLPAGDIAEMVENFMHRLGMPVSADYLSLVYSMVYPQQQQKEQVD